MFDQISWHSMASQVGTKWTIIDSLSTLSIYFLDGLGMAPNDSAKNYLQYRAPIFLPSPTLHYLGTLVIFLIFSSSTIIPIELHT